MQLNRTNKSPTQVSLQISADTPELEPIKKHVLSHFADRVKIPGFRAGKAPPELIEKHVNQQAMLEDFLEHAIDHFYRQSLKHEKLRPAAPPKVEVKKFVPFSQLVFTAEVEVLGEIKLADYKKIKLAKKPAAISAKEVDDVLKSLQLKLAERQPVSRPAKVGDELVIDFSGKDQTGKAISGASGQDYPLVLGSSTFIPGFEDHLMGVNAGDAKEFNLNFPKDYGASALQGKKATFSVKVKKIHELNKPKLDDTFAAKAGPFKTLAELKADIKRQLTVEKQQQADRAHETELIKKITDESTLEIPEVMIAEEISRMEEEEKRNLAYKSQTWKEHLDAEGINEEQHRQRHRQEALFRVKAGLVLSEVVEQEKVQVTPEEVEQRLQLMKEHYRDPAMQAELNKPEARREITGRLITEKTINKLVGYATSGK